eukprot:419262_1
MATKENIELAMQTTTNTAATKQNDPLQSLLDNDLDTESKVSDHLKELFYIYYKHHISGPYNPKEIVQLYMTSKIEDEIYVKNIKNAEEKDEWYRVSLSKTPTKESIQINNRFKEKFPALYAYLIPKIQSKAMQQFTTPVDTPEGALQKISLFTRITLILGKMVAALTLIFITIHVLPTLIIALCIWSLPVYLMCGNETDEEENVLYGGTIFISYLGLIAIPFFVVYYVLLDSVDYSEWDGEIQSWMVAYLAWGMCAYLFTVGIVAGGILSKEDVSPVVRAIANTMFWIIGVDFGDIDPLLLLGEYQTFSFAGVFLFPALASVLPAAIVGFIANFILETKFELKCGGSITSNVLCFDDGHGCCEVISSHDVSNSYVFIGGLASNVLATWAVVRIIGYLMVNLTPEAAMFAKKK